MRQRDPRCNLTIASLADVWHARCTREVRRVQDGHAEETAMTLMPRSGATAPFFVYEVVGACDATEVSRARDAKVRIGIIALPDCSSIVMAHELGLFKRYGIESTISRRHRGLSYNRER